MFQKYCLYRLFCINKLNDGRTFSCWFSPTTTFGGRRQLLQIKNRNCCQLSCLLQPQELCQRNLFCSGNVRGDHSFYAKNANSSNIRLSRMPINDIIKQKEQQQHSGRATEKRIKNHEDFETRFLQLGDTYNKKELQLGLKKGRSGHIFFDITIFVSGSFFNFNSILVPQDAYAFLLGFDKLIGVLATKNFQQKLINIKAPQSMIDASPQLKHELNIRNVVFTGYSYRYILKLVLFINADKGKMQKQIFLQLCSVHKFNASRRKLTLPLQALHWLRNQMAEMLIRHDGAKAIAWKSQAQTQKQSFLKNDTRNFHLAVQSGPYIDGKLEKKKNPWNSNKFDEPPAPIEEIYSEIDKNLANMEKALKKMSKENIELKKEIDDLKRGINDKTDVLPVTHTSNGLSSGSNFDQKGIQQQFFNKKPGSFQQFTKMPTKIQNSSQSGVKNQNMFRSLPIQQIPNMKQSEVKKPIKSSSIEQLDPQIAALEGGIQTFFGFDDEDMENYRRIAAKIKYPSRH